MAKLSDAQAQEAVAKLQGWTLHPAAGDRPSSISKAIHTGGFLKGLGLVTQAAVLAEKHGHHPDVLLTWPRVTFTLSTHDAGGLTEKDFALAGELDQLA